MSDEPEPEPIKLVAIDEGVLEELVLVATSDASADDVTPTQLDGRVDARPSDLAAWLSP